MPEYRPIKIRIWVDDWFNSLNIEERLFWIFLLTNNYFHISGIYEIPMSHLCVLSGCPNALKIIERFKNDKKIDYKNGWILIKNYLRNNNRNINKQDKITKSIITYISENKQLIKLFNLENDNSYMSFIRLINEISMNHQRHMVKVIKNKVIKIKDNSLQDKPVVSEIIPNLLEDKQKHIQIIGLWARAKKIVFTGKNHQRSFIRRNLRAAQNLVPYDLNRIMEVMAYLIRNADFKSTLESVGKFIDEDLTKLNNKPKVIIL